MKTTTFEIPTNEQTVNFLLARLPRTFAPGNWEVQAAARDIVGLLEAIKRDQQRSVFFVAVDNAKTRFSLYYIEDGQAEKFWPHCDALAKLYGMSTSNKGSLPKWFFRSGIFGTDRTFEATQQFVFLLGDLLQNTTGANPLKSFQFTFSKCLTQ